MALRFEYEVCPECGLENPERKPACARCDNRMCSEDEEAHRRYVALVEAEHRKRSIQWYCGWGAVALAILWALGAMVAGRRVTHGPGWAVLVGALLLGWRLIDARAKRAGSAAFLRRHAGRL